MSTPFTTPPVVIAVTAGGLLALSPGSPVDLPLRVVVPACLGVLFLICLFSTFFRGHPTTRNVLVGIAVGTVVASVGMWRLERVEMVRGMSFVPVGEIVVQGRALHDLRPSPSDLRRLDVELISLRDGRGWRGSATGRITLFWRGDGTLIERSGRERVLPLRGDTVDAVVLSEGLRDGTVWFDGEAARIAPNVRWDAALRRRLRRILRERYLRLDRNSRGLVTALLLGDRGSLDPELYESIRASGGAHVLALSGMHLGVLALVVRAAVGTVLSRRPALVVTVAILSLYVWVTGWIPSLMRALALTAVVAVASFRGCRRPGHVHLAVAVVLLAVIRPDLFGDLGFQYSVLALTGLFVLYPGIRAYLSWFIPPVAASYVAASMAAILATAPLSLAVFGVIYPGGVIFAGLLTVIVVGVMWLGLIMAVAAGIPLVGSGLVRLLERAVSVLYLAGRIGSQIPAARFSCSFGRLGHLGRLGGSVWLYPAFLAVAASVVLLLRRRGRKRVTRQKGSIGEPHVHF